MIEDEEREANPKHVVIAVIVIILGFPIAAKKPEIAVVAPHIGAQNINISKHKPLCSIKFCEIK